MPIEELLEKYKIDKEEFLDRLDEDEIGYSSLLYPVGFSKINICEDGFVKWYGIGENKKTTLKRRLKILGERKKMFKELYDNDDITKSEYEQNLFHNREQIAGLKKELEALDEKRKI